MEKFEKEKLTGNVYEAWPISSIDQLHALISDHPQLAGLNVTIPYKEQVLPYLTQQSDVVQQTGACNCIKIVDGKLIGYNTDVTGFEISLKRLLQPHHRNALILGTGGAAKAVEYVLNELYISHVNVSRTPSAHQFSYEQITRDIMQDYTLIINTTPLGMYPNITQAPPIPYEFVTNKHYLFDLIYNPATTLFLERGAAKGAAIQNGLEMLILQAEESWRIWNEVS